MSVPVSASGKKTVDEARIGECVAPQPVSGTELVGETFAVNGMGRGAYVRTEKAEKNKEENFRFPVTQGRA